MQLIAMSWSADMIVAKFARSHLLCQIKPQSPTHPNTQNMGLDLTRFNAVSRRKISKCARLHLTRRRSKWKSRIVVNVTRAISGCKQLIMTLRSSGTITDGTEMPNARALLHHSVPHV